MKIIIIIIIIIIRAEKISLKFYILRHDKKLAPFRFFTAIFLISVVSSVFPAGRMWDEIWLRYVVLGDPVRRDDLFLNLYMTKRLGVVCQHANKVICKVKLALEDRLAKRRLASKLIKTLGCHVISGLFNT